MIKKIFQNNIFNKNKKKGFTIVETLVAIFILVLSITGPMVFAQSGLRASIQARDQVTAFFLAQDIIETVKNIRDDNHLDGEDWRTNLIADGKCGSYTPCMIDTTVEIPSAISCGSTCPPLRVLETTSGVKYNYSSEGTESRFTRTMYINLLPNSHEAEVVVEVEWITSSVGRHRIVVQENIYNWLPI